MKIYNNKNVLEASLDRIRRLYDDFDEVVVGMSGGKDSTVVYNLCMQVAKEKNRLPLSVMWLDQEAEWQGTVDFVSNIMHNPDVNPLWLQIPFTMTNNASTQNRYVNTWFTEEKEHWIHPQSGISIKENVYGTNRFHDMFQYVLKYHFGDKRACYMAGMRTEESPKRMVSLTGDPTYKEITWGKILDKKIDHYTFYPIYDWSYTDVWKYIHDNNLEYNRVYDEMYRHGVPVKDMRISNLHHETSIQSLMLVQEIEPDTWNRISARVDGANTIKHIKGNSFRCPKNLPYMFNDWKEYAYFLGEKLIGASEHYESFLKTVERYEKVYTGAMIKNRFYRKVIDTILCADFDYTKLKNWTMSGEGYSYKNFKMGKRKKEMLQHKRFFTKQEYATLITEIDD